MYEMGNNKQKKAVEKEISSQLKKIDQIMLLLVLQQSFKAAISIA